MHACQEDEETQATVIFGEIGTVAEEEADGDRWGSRRSHKDDARLCQSDERLCKNS